MAFLNSIYKALTGVDVESLLQKLSEREAEVQELKAKIASQATTITLQSTKIKELNKNIKESLEGIEITQTQLTEAKVANSLNYNARLVAEEKLSKLEKDLSEEKKNKSAVEQMFNDTQVELSKANNQIKELSEKNNSHSNEIRRLTDLIEKASVEKTAQSDKIEKLNKNLKESSENLDSVKEQLDEEHTSNKTLTLKVSHFQSRISKLKKDLEDEQTSKSAVEERLNEAQVELSNANKQISEYSLQIETTQNSLKEIEDKFVQQTNLLQQEKEKYANAEQLLSKAESDSKELNSELSAANEQISELSTKLQQTQNEKEEALAENLSLNKQLQELSEKIALQESIVNEKTTSDNVDVAEEGASEITDKDIEENEEYEVEENVEEVPQEDESTEFEIDWDNTELEISDVEQDTILTDSTLSITKVWDVRNKKEIDAKQFFSLPEGEIMSMRRELQLAITTDNPYWVCPVCGQMVKISGKRIARGKALFFSHLHDSEDCPIKTNSGLTKRMIEARKYALVQESERHHRLKTSIANFLEETNSKNKGVSDVQIEKRVTTDLPFMNWRCPDVQAMYNGMHLVFELQLSTTFISTIVERDLFYRLNNYFIIWVFNFEENKEYMDLTNLMCKDIYYANKRNIFVFDRDAQTESFKRKELVLKCNWLNADNTWQYGPNDGDRNGIFITLDQLKFDTKNNKPYYYDAEKEYFLKHQDKVVLREKQELDLQTVLEGLERREQQKKERKELRDAKKAEVKANLDTVADVVADDKVVLPDTVNAEPEEKKTLGKINANGHEYVDLGLPSGTLWATCNVGATKPEEYGDYFAWGEVRPRRQFFSKKYKWFKRNDIGFTKYCNDKSFGVIDNKINLDVEDDAAYVNWGGDWRMPNNTELEELRTNCTWTWKTKNGVNGYEVASKTNSNRIFLPAAGFRYGKELNNADSDGYYWSCLLYTNNSNSAYDLIFEKGKIRSDYHYRRYYGQSVRPVLRVEFTLSFVPNGGQGEMPAVVKPFKQAFTLPACTFKRDGYEFIAWNTQPDGTGEKYEAGDTISLSSNITLYAQWKEIPTKENMHNGHEYVDLGLPSGTLWATCNVGATKPEEYGDYFAWGETEPKSKYSWKNYMWCHAYKYGKDENKTILDLRGDVANVKWGGIWTMPTKDELEELIDDSYTTWAWVSLNEVRGYNVTSKINGNSIFLPAAGYRYDIFLYNAGPYGNYRSSSLYTYNSLHAYYLGFDSGNVGIDHFFREYGYSVRPVLRVEFTLSFVPNGGQGEMPAVVKPFKQALTLPTCTFKRDGYEFIGWNTQPDGTGEKYEAGETISLSANTTLYAQWKEIHTKENMHNGHEYVDLGLPSGTLWATCNVGATKPEEYGDYFAWGETEPKKKMNNDCEYKLCNNHISEQIKYCTALHNGIVDNKTILDLCDDAANADWGGNWHIPTKEQQEELIAGCTCLWIKEKGVIGYRFTSKLNGNSIFLPAAGYYWSGELKRDHSRYWSSSLCTNDSAFSGVLSLYSWELETKYASRTRLYSVRPVFHVELTYEVSFDSNGGVGTMDTIVLRYADIFNVPNCLFIRNSSQFMCWNTKSDGTGKNYVVGSKFSISSNIVLYAKWNESICENMHNIHEYIDLGLPSGNLWATCNVGAFNPEEYGDYFVWGETEPKKKYSWDHKYKDENNNVTKYNLDIDGKNILDLCDDAANVNWGGNWRIPNVEDINELCNECIWEWISKNGNKGYKIVSKFNANSIFLPAAGQVGFMEGHMFFEEGQYLINSLYTKFSSDSDVSCLLFRAGEVCCSCSSRYEGLSVRPVLCVKFTYDIKFVSNGGKGFMKSIVINRDERITIPDNKFTREGYEFIGWNTCPDGAGKNYTPLKTVGLNSNITLYAQWMEIPQTNLLHNAHEYVDLGLPSGTLWATCNVGATKPEECGDYFAWGEINHSTRCIYEKYYSAVYNSNREILELCDDIANYTWGGDWRMPTKKEQDELRTECIWRWITKNGMDGYWVIGPNGNSIFLPAAGYRAWSELFAIGSHGSYWSCSFIKSTNVDDEDLAYALVFGDKKVYISYPSCRVSNSIRPVLHVESYEITFDSNGGEGTMPSVSFCHTGKIPKNKFIRTDYDFISWNTKADGSGKIYREGDIIGLKNITLYAQWFKKFSVSKFANR